MVKWTWKCSEPGCKAHGKKPLPHSKARFHGKLHMKNKHNNRKLEPIIEKIDIITFYKKAKKIIIEKGYQKEIEIVENRKYEDITPSKFFDEYLFVVLNSGMKNQIAEKIYKKYWEIAQGFKTQQLLNGLSAIKHEGKHAAIERAIHNCIEWYDSLDMCKTDTDKISYLETLPWIGQITKYHLARNLGIDCAKPDRHLQRVAKYFGYTDVQQMCKELSNFIGERIGTIDIVLWRYCNIFPRLLED